MLVRGQDRMSLRCPVCLGRDMDIVLLRDKEGYYCVKCSFTGSAEDVEDAYTHFRSRFRLRGKRLALGGNRASLG